MTEESTDGTDKELLDSEGYRSLKAAVEKDCNEKTYGCFNTRGCDKEWIPIPCFHRYCNKFKWIIEMVEHYSEKTDIPQGELLTAFEKKRDYWYMNYYQGSCQPRINGNNVRVYDSIEAYRESIDKRGFRCPSCNEATLDPVECDRPDCDWKAYGLLGTLGKGVSVFVKDLIMVQNLFKPIAWEEEDQPTAAPAEA